MNIDTATKEELAEVLKSIYVQVKQDIPATNFKAGEWYYVEQDYSGITLYEDTLGELLLLDYDMADKYLMKR